MKLISTSALLLILLLPVASYAQLAGHNTKYEGWLNPSAWHGGIPPVSLVAFAVFAVGYLADLFGRK